MSFGVSPYGTIPLGTFEVEAEVPEEPSDATYILPPLTDNLTSNLTERLTQ